MGYGDVFIPMAPGYYSGIGFYAWLTIAEYEKFDELFICQLGSLGLLEEFFVA
jgi:hypothetical protein